MRSGRGLLALLCATLAGSAGSACHDAIAPAANPVGTYVLTQVNGKGPPWRLVYDSAQNGVTTIYAVADTIWIMADRSAHRSEAYSYGDPTTADSVQPFRGASYGGFYYTDGPRLVVRWRVPVSSAFDPGMIVYDTLTMDGTRLRRDGVYRIWSQRYPAQWVYARK